MNKGNRPESPSGIPRLVQNLPLFSPCESLSRSPSPIKNIPGSRIPTPTGSSKIQSDMKKTISHKSLQSSPFMQSGSDFFDFNEMQDGFGQALEEMSLPSSPSPDHNMNSQIVKDDIAEDPSPSPEYNIYANNSNQRALAEEDIVTPVQKKSQPNNLVEEEIFPGGSYENMDLISEQLLLKSEDVDISQVLSNMEEQPERDSKDIKKSKAITFSEANEQIEMTKKHIDNKTDVKLSPRRKELNNSLEYDKQIVSTENVTHLKENVMYITKKLLNKITKDADILAVQELNLSLSKQWKRKIQFIENIEGFINLVMLNLSNNYIQKIQNLDSLTNLRHVDLSLNRINTLDGLDRVTSLETLNVNNNCIEVIPRFLPKKLKNLSVLRMTHNNFRNLDEVQKLSPLNNLHQIDVAENPFCKLSHFSEFIVFHLRNLNMIDGKLITSQQRTFADERFNQDELQLKQKQQEELLKNIKALDSACDLLQDEKKQWLLSEKKLNDKITNLKKSLRAKVDELATKNQILESQASELSKACEKQYKLEQELAFHKLDAKFDELWIPSAKEEEMVLGSEYMDGGESTYLGKARYKQRQSGTENIVLSDEQTSRFVSFIERLDQDALMQNDMLRNAFLNAANINVAETQLELQEVKEKLHNAEKALSTEQKKCSSYQNGVAAHLETRRQQANDLENAISKLEGKASECEQMFNFKEDEVNMLKLQLENMRTDDPVYKVVATKLIQAEEEKNNLLSRLNELNCLLKDANTELVKCVQDMKEMEQQLQHGNEPEIYTSHIKELNNSLAIYEDKVERMSKENADYREALKESESTRKLEEMKMTELKAALEEKSQGDQLENERLTNLMRECDSLKLKLEQESEKVKKIMADNTLLTRKNNVLHSKMIDFDELQSELEDLRLAVSSKNADKNQVLSYVKALTNDLITKSELSKPKRVSEKSMQAALKNLRNCLVDIIASFKNFKHQMNDTHNQSGDDLHAAKENITELKHILDIKESNERVMKYMLDDLKEQLCKNEVKYTENLKEYDDIANELKNQIEILEEKNGKLNNQVNKLREKIKLENTDLLDALNLTKNELKYWKDIADGIKCQTQDLLNQKDENYDNEMEKVVKELRLTKNYIDKLRTDFGKWVDNSYIQTFDGMLHDVQSKLQGFAMKTGDMEIILQELRDIKLSIQDMHSSSQKNQLLDAACGGMVKRIDLLLQQLLEGDDKSHVIVEDLRDPVVIRVIEQIQLLKQSLKEKDRELNCSNVPLELVNLQRIEIANLLAQLDLKDNELKYFKGKERRKAKVPPFAASTPIHPHILRHIDMKPMEVYHQYHMNHAGEMALNENPLFCNIEEHLGNDNSMHAPDPNLYDKLEKLAKSRDDLRWELNHLESKIGNAVLRRSISRQTNRYSYT